MIRSMVQMAGYLKVCIVAEGCYPYVVGGVSSWIHSLINSFPETEFILLTIVANRSFRGKFVYDLPERRPVKGSFSSPISLEG